MKTKRLVSLLLALILFACSAVPAQAADQPAELPFTDVPKDAWYYHAVSVCWSEGILQGVSETKFDPSASVTREMVAMILYRIAGGEPVPYEPIFSDVPEGAWYSDAIIWDYQQGLVKGVKPATETAPAVFGLGRLTTREQIMTFLYRLAGEPELTGSLSAYQDAGLVSGYAKNAMTWATQEYILLGNLQHYRLYLRPQDNCTRAELAQILLRYLHPEERKEFNPPPLAETPVKLSGKATINTTQVPQLYGTNAGVAATSALIKASDLKLFWPDVTLKQKTSNGKYTCTVRLGGKTFQYTNETGGAAFDGDDWYLPCRDFPIAFGYTEYLDSSENHVFYTKPLVKLSGKATINGIAVPQLYGQTSGVAVTSAMLKSSDLKLFWSDATCTKTASNGKLVCTVRLGGKVFQYTNGTDGVLYDGKDWYLPCRAFPKAFGYSEYLDSKENHVFYTPLPDVSKIPSGRKVPVLMYHATGEPFSGGITELFVSAANLEAQLKYIKQNGFSAIWFEDLPKLSSYQKPVILTFDDGYKDNYTVLFPLLKKYNVKATIFIFPNNIGTNNNFLTWDMVREMQASGLVSFQSHTMSHSDLDSLSEAKQRTELEESKRIITEKTGRECFVLCYPSGKYNNTTLYLAKQSYLFGIKMNGNLYTTGTNRFLVPRYYVARSTSLSAFASMITH